MKFISKSDTLHFFKKKNNLNIPKFIFFTVDNFKKNKNKYLNKIEKIFEFKKIIIRSSAIGEDSKETSMAGQFESVQNVNPNDKISVEYSILKVIKSYKKNNPNNKILVQLMINQPKLHGVIFTSDRNDKSPYFCINYSKSNDTSLITSGKEDGNVFYFYKNSKILPKNKLLKIIINETKKITNLSKEDDLDIEFVIDKKNKFYLLQVRPIVQKNKLGNSGFNYNFFLDGFSKKIAKLNTSFKNLYGKYTIFSNMSDWNPAEMIGIRPKNLSMSLYKELITNNVWSKNRSRYGFNEVENMPLMVSFFGSPYIDMRVDFNSWLPKNLTENMNEKIVNFYLSELKNNPSDHDKIEFKIVFTCFTFDTEKRLKEKNFLNKNEKKKLIYSLKKITNIAFQEIQKDEKQIKILTKKNNDIIKSNSYFINKIYWLLENCKRYGTDPFAGLARCGFIGMELLNSLVNKKILSQEEKSVFLKSFNTITKNILVDVNKKNKYEFIKKYGHLRPSTYDITSQNYKDGYKNYFSNRKTSKINLKKTKFKLDTKRKNQINKLLKKEKLQINCDDLFKFIKKSIQMREYGKFIFTKTIDEIFLQIKSVAKRSNIDFKDMQFMDINLIKKLYLNIDAISVKEELKKNIIFNKKNFLENNNIKLPDLIRSKNEAYFFEDFIKKPNFITNKVLNGEIIFLEKNFKSLNLKNKIICIENADPGYDYLFTKKIKGLITKYGGVNSHMAIRCNELNLPAAIGVGDNIFNSLKKFKNIQVNCFENIIKYLK